MQTCSNCYTQSPDNIKICPNCKVNLDEFSITAISLKKMQENPRVGLIRISAAADACPACRRMMAAYDKKEVPVLPVKGCSHANGCRCFYDPILEEIYP